MMDRKQYNECMRPFLTGTKTKEQRKLDFCIGAKVCSGKASDKAAAESICSPAGKAETSSIEGSSTTVSQCSGKPMAEWIQEEGQGECRPCLLGPVVQWYRDTLAENNKPELATSLEEKVIDADPLTLCSELDRIKTVVENPIRERLKDFDCAAQTFSPDDAT